MLQGSKIAASRESSFSELSGGNALLFAVVVVPLGHLQVGHADLFANSNFVDVGPDRVLFPLGLKDDRLIFIFAHAAARLALLRILLL